MRLCPLVEHDMLDKRALAWGMVDAVGGLTVGGGAYAFLLPAAM